jgi:integrase
MPRIAKPLTALEVGRLSADGYHAVGTVAGLYLQVKGAAKTWIFRIKIGDKRRDIGLGAYPSTTLAMAHQKARERRAEVEVGIDPVQQKKAAKSLTRANQSKILCFDKAAEAYVKAKEKEWRNAKHGSQWTATLETYAYPVMGKLAVSDIDLHHVLKVLEPIWETKTVTASRLRGRIETVLDWATVRGHRTGLNPARWKGHLDKLLAAPNKIKGEEHHPAVLATEGPAFMRDLRKREGVGARALEFAMLTAARSGEARLATWPEIDLEGKLWTIPADRMKAGVAHREPLSDVAIRLLKALPRMADTDLVFPSPRGNKALSDMTLTLLMRRMDYRDRDGRVCVPHGLRSTFTDWMAENTSYGEAVSDAALSHQETDKTRSAYFRTDLFRKRTRAMAAWARYLDKVPAKGGVVVPISSKVA